MANHSIEEWEDLLGPAVFLPITRGSKKPTLSGWQKKSMADMRNASYRARLRKAHNLGVLVGQPSQGLCTIDIDSDDRVDEFLALNPSLSSTLRTAAARGCNLWIRVEGSHPRLTPIVTLTREKWGEFRADGGQTVIAGIHPEGFDYRALVKAKPIVIRYDQLVWPPDVQISGAHTAHAGSSSLLHSAPLHGYTPAPSTRHCTSTPLHANHAEARLRHAAAQEAKREFEADREVNRLYDRLVRNRYVAKPSGRNAALVEMTAFLFRAVSHPVAKLFVTQFYREGQTLFHDPLDQHLKEFEAQWRGVRESYYAHLSRDEMAAYGALLEEDHQVCFRVCRSLALLPDLKFPPPEFYLGSDQLGLRLGPGKGRSAYNHLARLRKMGVIHVVEPGSRRATGVSGKATRYRWALPGFDSGPEGIAN